MYGKALVCVGERGVEVMLERGLRVCEGEVVLLHVEEPIAETIGGEDRRRLVEEARARGELSLRGVCAKLESLGRSYHARVEFGAVAETIVKVADEEGAELIVMRTDGRDSLRDMFLGSITERVLNASFHRQFPAAA